MKIVVSQDKIRTIIFAWFDKKYSGLTKEKVQSKTEPFTRYVRGHKVYFYYFYDSGTLLVSDPQVMETPFKFVKDYIDYNEFAVMVGEWFSERYDKNVVDVEI